MRFSWNSKPTKKGALWNYSRILTILHHAAALAATSRPKLDLASAIDRVTAAVHLREFPGDAIFVLRFGGAICIYRGMTQIRVLLWLICVDVESPPWCQ